MRRRRLLALLAASPPLAGCTGPSPREASDGDGNGTPTTDTDTDDPSPPPSGSPTASPTSTSTPTDTPADATVRLTPVEPPTGDATLVVYPTDLRSWLREAASADAALRVHATTPVVMPEPPLPAFDRVRLGDPAGEADGWYAVGGDAGIRYHYLAGATEVPAPDDEPIMPVADLPDARRRLAVAAIRGETGDEARFYPETELGEWARTEFFGGYVRHDGAVYRGMEVQQTDAAFFSRECWYVLSLDPVDGGTGPTLVLADVDDDVRRVVDDMLGARDPEESVTRPAADVPGQVARFVEGTDYLLTHSAVFAASVETG